MKYTYLVIFLFTLSFVLPSCMGPKKTFKKSVLDAPFDAIIVPGCPFENGSWSSLMKIRVYWAKYLYDNGLAKNIVFSGGAIYSPYFESKIMGLYAEKLGIKSENIFYENRAEHSTENVFYSIQLAKENNWNKVGLATDPFQSNMLKRFTRKRNLGVFHLPIDFDILNKIDMFTPEIVPNIAFCDTFVSIEVRESKLERWRGTRGKHIKW